MASRADILKNSVGHAFGFAGTTLGKAVMSELPELAHVTGLISAIKDGSGSTKPNPKLKQVKPTVPANGNSGGSNINPAYLRMVGNLLSSIDANGRRTINAISSGNSRLLTQATRISAQSTQVNSKMGSLQNSLAAFRTNTGSKLTSINRRLATISNNLMKSSTSSIQLMRDLKTLNQNQKDILKTTFTTTKDLGKAADKNAKNIDKTLNKILAKSNSTIEIIKDIRKTVKDLYKTADKTLDVNKDQLRVLKDIEKNTRNPMGTSGKRGKGNSSSAFGQDLVIAENVKIIDLLDHMDREMVVSNREMGKARASGKSGSLNGIPELKGSEPMKLLTQQTNALVQIQEDDVKVIDLLDYIRTDLAEIKTEDKKANKFNQVAARDTRFNEQKSRSLALTSNEASGDTPEKKKGLFSKLFANGAGIMEVLKGVFLRTIIPGIVGLMGAAILALAGKDTLLAIKHAYNDHQINGGSFGDFAHNIMDEFFKMMWHDLGKAAYDYIPGMAPTVDIMTGNVDSIMKRKADADAAHQDDIKNGRDPTSRMFKWVKGLVSDSVDDMNVAAARPTWDAQGRALMNMKKQAPSSVQAANIMMGQKTILDEGYADAPSGKSSGNTVVAPITTNNTNNTVINKNMNARNPTAKDVQSSFVAP